MKLCILDKDGTLTTPVSGANFPQNPQDQQLLPGVKEAIDRLRADGWSLAIASNQGGCDWHEIYAKDIRIGQSFKFIGPRYDWEAKEVHLYQGDLDLSFKIPGNDMKILVQHKTIESAIEECQFAADLCGIENFAFCPAMDGMRMIVQSKIHANGWLSAKSYSFGDYFGVGHFRKPGPGMLDFFQRMFSAVMPDDRTIMIGDRPEDEAAALAAGFRFMDAQEWRNGASVEGLGCGI